ncbi:MAG: hypothetical protein JWN86_3980 [Planctomycetota bacterium]|nr:hypothetical protein [Planctomycetota bacterium]
MLRRALNSLSVWSVLILAAAPATAQVATIDNLFPEAAHDFGTVARGAKLRYTFWLVNTTNADIQILSWRPKCGCTEVKVGAQLVPPGTRTPIEATLDTTRFQGRKDSGLTLVLNGSSYAEKDLNLSCFIRGDILLNPGVASFGVVPRGQAPSVVMNLSYLGGDPNWRITAANTISKNLSAKVDGPFQNPGGGLQYQITAALNSSAPTGYFKDEITLITSDRSSPTIPISVVANIEAAVVVSPGNLVFGRVKAGSTVTKNVLVRSSQSFKIVDATSAKGEISAQKGEDLDKKVHPLTITFKAPMRPGAYNAEMQITTNLKDEPPAKFTAYATIVP